MVRWTVAVVALLPVLVLFSFGVLIYGTSSSEPGQLLSVSPVENRSAPTPPYPPPVEKRFIPTPSHSPPLDTEQLWSAALAQDLWPDLAIHSRTGTSGNRIALTFDDGPDPRTTPLILDTLREHDLEATFFVVGRQVAENPGILRRIVEEGHTLGNHTYDHADMSDLSPEGMRNELQSTQEIVDEALGYHYPMILMRPPYGNPYFDGSDALPAFRRVVREQGLFPVTWTVDPRDYLYSGRPEGVVRSVMRADEVGRRSKSDQVLLLHDNHEQTAQALPGIIDYYEGSDRQFADVGELLADKYVEP